MLGLRSALIRGAGWTFAMRWATRLLGLLSTAILARLLSPTDFGLVAMAMIVVGFVDSWLNLGIDSALIQNQSADREDYDTAWTLRILQAVLVAIMILAAAPFAADYFRDERVVPLLWVLCFGLLISAFSNIGVVNFRKELQFDREFRYNVYAKFLGFPVTIGAAFALGNYWALAIGSVIGYAILCALSYGMHPYRPRFTLSRWRSLWSYSKWMLLRSVGHFAETRADEILVGGQFSTQQMGLYSVASELGQLPGSEIAAPLNNAMLPTFARIQDDPTRVADGFVKVVGVVGTLAIPAGVGLAAVSEHLVPVFLGNQWVDAAPVLAILAIYGGVLRWKVSLVVNLSLALGRPSLAAGVSWFSLITLIPIAWILARTHGLPGIAFAKLMAGALLIAFTYGLVRSMVPVRISDLFRNLWRPYLAAAGMWLVVASLPTPMVGEFVLLFYKSIVGALTYTSLITCSWLASGRPDGAELIVWEKIRPHLPIRRHGR